MWYERNQLTGRMNKVWTCNEPGCSKEFRRVCSLKDHLRIHSDDKPFTCSLCNRGWAQKGNRDRHVRLRICQNEASSESAIIKPAAQFNQAQEFEDSNNVRVGSSEILITRPSEPENFDTKLRLAGS